MPSPTVKYGKLFMKDSSGNLVQIMPRASVSVPDYQGATASASGVAGLVPAAQASQKDKFLRGDGTWQEVATETVNLDALVESAKMSNLLLKTGLDASLTKGTPQMSELMNAAERQVDALGRINPTSIALSASSAETLNNSAADFICANDTISGADSAIVCRSLELKDTSIASSKYHIISEKNVSITNVTLTGTTPGSSNTKIPLRINSDGYVKISNCRFGSSSYNGIQFIPASGYTNNKVKGVLIDNCTFENIQNNTIDIVYTADNAVITISNCIFKETSNPIRICNTDNVHLTLNLINCIFEELDQSLDYRAVICCQDSVAASAEATASDNRFAPEKITVNVVNCIDPSGNVISAPSQMSQLLGSRSCANPLIYLYGNKTGLISYSASRYPSVNIVNAGTTGSSGPAYVLTTSDPETDQSGTLDGVDGVIFYVPDLNS